MIVRTLASIFLASVLGAGTAAAREQTFRSTDRQVVLLELFTSQGCSSCPPADQWLSGLMKQEGLWTGFVPIALHVDYWDSLGWKDPFASPTNTERQHHYGRAGRLGSVYTPGMVAAGREWRGWRRGQAVPRGSGRPGVLEVRLEANRLRARFSGEGRGLEFHWAVLGFGLTTKVTHGENAGRNLKSDFVVLHQGRGRAGETGWEASWPPRDLPRADRYGLAAWLSHPDDPTPVQATGGWLDSDPAALRLGP